MYDHNSSVFSGDLRFIALADVFQILGGINATGTLTMSNPYAIAPGLIHFLNGSPVNAAMGSLSGIEAIYALFGWTRGVFQFNEESIEVDRVVKKGRMQIVLDALRMLDDGRIRRIGPFHINEKVRWEYGENDHLPHVLGPLVDYTYVISEEKFLEGRAIVTEGGYGSWIWVVLEGAVDIIRKTPDGQKTVARLGAGSFVGTFASLLFREYPRTATVVSAGKTHLGLLDTVRLSAEYSSLSPDFRNFLFSLSGRMTKITDRALREPVPKEGMDQGLLKDQRPLVEKGSEEEAAFVITEGEGHVVLHTSKGDIPLITLGKHDIFGHVPFIDMGQEPQCASVIGTKDLKIREIDTEHLLRDYERLSDTFRNMIENAGTCVSVTTQCACRLMEEKFHS
jgi:CRP-like cAMP-binding protein